MCLWNTMEQTFQYLKVAIISCMYCDFLNHHPLVFLLTAVWLISDTHFTHILTLLAPYTQQICPHMSAAEFFSLTWNSTTAHKMILTTISSQQNVGTLVMFMCWTCIHTGEGRCHYTDHIPCYTIYSTNACNVSILIISGMVLILWFSW
jgi:hypothetical protein